MVFVDLHERFIQLNIFDLIEAKEETTNKLRFFENGKKKSQHQNKKICFSKLLS